MFLEIRVVKISEESIMHRAHGYRPYTCGIFAPQVSWNGHVIRYSRWNVNVPILLDLPYSDWAYVASENSARKCCEAVP